MLEWVLNRAKESGTWAGLAGVAGAFGITDAEYQAGSAVVMAVCGFVAVVLKEKGIIKD